MEKIKITPKFQFIILLALFFQKGLVELEELKKSKESETKNDENPHSEDTELQALRQQKDQLLLEVQMAEIDLKQIHNIKVIMLMYLIIKLCYLCIL